MQHFGCQPSLNRTEGGEEEEEEEEECTCSFVIAALPTI
jgi:hypothetical protein